MTLRRVEEIERDAAGKVVRREYRYADTAKTGPSVASRPAPSRTTSPQEESALVKELRDRVAVLEQRVAHLEARPEPPAASATVSQPSDSASLQELARAVQSGLQRISTLEQRVTQTDDHGGRLTTIEGALGALAEMSAQVATEKSAD